MNKSVARLSLKLTQDFQEQRVLRASNLQVFSLCHLCQFQVLFSYHMKDLG